LLNTGIRRLRVTHWEYRAVELQLVGQYEVRDHAGNWRKQQGPHVAWRTGAQSMDDALRDFGSNGWEMCGVAPSTQNFTCHILYFKRAVQA
jgi:hypothetical protein